MSAPKKCRGCKVRVKLHKFGQWGPDCSGPPPGWNSGGDEKPTDVLDQLRIITDRLAKLEVASGTNGATHNSALPSSDEEIELESMSREQMLEYIKNSNKHKDDLAKAAKTNGSRKTRFDVEDREPRSRGLSISNLFDAHYLRGQEEQNLHKAADKLKEKHRTNSKDVDNRIAGVPIIDDLRRDPRLAGAADDFLRDAAGRAPWLQHPGDRVRGSLPPPAPQHSRDDGWGRNTHRDSRDGDREWASRDAFLLNRNKGEELLLMLIMWAVTRR